VRIAAALALGLLLAGCMSEQQKQLLAQQTAAADDAKCRSYGFQPGSDGFELRKLRKFWHRWLVGLLRPRRLCF
jgi:hypothetical protein